jgi:hypothetical protein
MKSAVSLALIVCLGSASPVAAQTPTDLGPIHRFIVLEASRLAAIQQNVQKESDPKWRGVIALERGRQLIVTDRAASVHRGYIAIADDSSLVIVNVDGAPIPTDARGTLEKIASHQTSYFADALHGQAYPLGNDLRLTGEGIFFRDQKVAGLDTVVSIIPSADVRQIAVIRHRGSVGAISGGAAAGVLLGLASFMGLAFKQCGGSCSDEELLMGASLFGFPVLGGSLGYWATRHEVERVVYRAP